MTDKISTEILTDRVSGKTTTVRVKVNEKGLRYITARQYNSALYRLGQGPHNVQVATDYGFRVYTDAGREYACVEGRL